MLPPTHMQAGRLCFSPCANRRFRRALILNNHMKKRLHLLKMEDRQPRLFQALKTVRVSIKIFKGCAVVRETFGHDNVGLHATTRKKKVKEARLIQMQSAKACGPFYSTQYIQPVYQHIDNTYIFLESTQPFK